MSHRTVLHATPWCTLVSLPAPDGSPYYMLESADYVCVVATARDRLLLVRQFRTVVGRVTLELPSGHVEAGEEPAAAARRELLEETGYRADRLELMGVLAPDVGRLANRMWCYFAPDAAEPALGVTLEPGVSLETVAIREGIAAAGNGTIDHALHLAAMFLAVAQGKISLGHPA
jgi:ADP-ribose pyrophosphatase